MKVVIADLFSEAAIHQLQAAGHQVVYNVDFKEDKLLAGLAAENPDVLVVRSTKVLPKHIEAASNLKMIVRAGSGYDNIDCAAAAARHVAVCNCPGMNAAAVAELVLAHMLAIDRRIPENVELFRTGIWNKGAYANCRGIKGTTMGLIGCGNIGKLVAARCRAFEMNVLIFDPVVPQETLVPFGRPVTTLREIAERSDFISIHVPGGDATKNMVNAEFLGWCRPGTVIINTSRASVINEPALIDAVRNHGLFAAVDVMSNEPEKKAGKLSHPFGEVPGIFVSHHIGASTKQAEDAVGEEALRVVLTFGGPSHEILHKVN